MIYKIGPLPDKNGSFDILQGIIVKAVSDNAATWKIPTAAIGKLTAKQTIWSGAWAIAKNRKNSTTAQRKDRDIARKNYEKVLRPFIQKWIYLNEEMDEADVKKCGLNPRDTIATRVPVPEAPHIVTVARGQTGELLPTCAAVENATYYGCLLVAKNPLPAWLRFENGQLRALEPDPALLNAGVNFMAVQYLHDMTRGRKKKVGGLQEGVVYYVYFYAGNASGLSPLSEPVSLKCW